jgi:cell shape-determining protein MreC
MTEIHRHAEIEKLIGEQQQRIRDLEVENQQLRQALERIRDLGPNRMAPVIAEDALAAAPAPQDRQP